MKEYESASRNRRELLLFPDCSRGRNRNVGNSEPNRGRIGTDVEASSNRFKKSKAPKIRALLAIEASQASDVGSIPIARSITHDDSIGLTHLNYPNPGRKWPFLDPKWTPVDVNWTLVFRRKKQASREDQQPDWLFWRLR